MSERGSSGRLQTPPPLARMVRAEAAFARPHSATATDHSTLGGLLRVYEAAIERGETLTITLEAGRKISRMSNMKFGEGKVKSAVAAEVPAARGSAAGSRKVAAPGGGTARKEESARKRKSRERMEKHIKEKYRQEQQPAGGAGRQGGGETTPAAAENDQTAPGPAGDPARDAGKDQVGTNVQEQQLAGGAGGQGGGEAASAAVQDKVVKEKEAKNKMAPGQAGAPARDAGQDQEGGTEDSEDLSTLALTALRARCKERGLPSKGSKADLRVRLSGSEEMRPLPQLRVGDVEKDKIVSPVKDDGRGHEPNESESSESSESSGSEYSEDEEYECDCTIFCCNICCEEKVDRQEQHRRGISCEHRCWYMDCKTRIGEWCRYEGTKVRRCEEYLKK